MDRVTDRTIPGSTEHIEVDVVDGHGQLLATNTFQPGEHILRLHGEVVDQPSKFSVQIGPGEHIDIPADVRAEQPLDRYRWRFLNHSCEPNAAFDGLNLVAIRTIRASDQITFDYDTTEYDMSTPFDCHCESTNCRGVVRGARWHQDQAGAEG